jgi:hypothetical protein
MHGDHMQKTLKIGSGKTLSSILDKIIKETTDAVMYTNGMEERERQASMLGEEDESSSEESSSKSVDDEKEKLKKGNVKAEDIIGKLNTIRSGKSFKDEEVSSKLNEYIESLSKAEKVALLAFLKGISQVVTGEINPESAVDPSDSPSNIEMKKADKKITIKPTVIAKKPAEEKKKKPSAEDTTGPTPITPVKK